MRYRAKVVALIVLSVWFGSSLGADLEWPSPDLVAIHKFEQEGLEHSRVAEVLSYLTDVYGPRLTNSPNIREASAYAIKTLQSWGLTNVHQEPWGPFGRGWSNESIDASEISPGHFPLIAYPKAWTPGTNGWVTAEVVYAKVEREQDLDAYHGWLKGKFVMTAPMRSVEAHFEPQAHRYTDQELADLAQAPAIAPAPDQAARDRLQAQRQLLQKIHGFLTHEGAAAWLEPAPRDGGTLTVLDGDSRNSKEAFALPRIAVAIEHYGRIIRTLEKNIPVTLRVNVANRFYDDTLDSFNILADIPGTDLAGEIVMLGAHFDSWHTGTGATDNGAGSAVMMEAMRILKVSGLPMRRTVRLALWTGEEQGLLGSRAYVKEHFADRQNMHLRQEHEKLSAYFNLDNGTGKIRGIYLQSNEALRPIFQKWMEPFEGMGMTTLSARSTGGTDHVSFDEVGLPGLQFIQDPMEYETRTHHTNMDVYERIQEPDLKQMAVIVASFVYMTANSEERLPRKALPKH